MQGLPVVLASRAAVSDGRAAQSTMTYGSYKQRLKNNKLVVTGIFLKPVLQIHRAIVYSALGF